MIFEYIVNGVVVLGVYVFRFLVIGGNDSVWVINYDGKVLIMFGFLFSVLMLL